MAFPALWRLRTAHPGARLIFVAAPCLHPLLAPYTDLYLNLDDVGLQLFLEGAEPPEGWHAGCRVALWMADPSGTARRNLARWGAQEIVHVADFRPGRHAARQLEGSIAHWGLADGEPPLLIPREGRGEALGGARDVVIHPGSGNQAKNWPLGNFLELATSLQARGLRTAFLLGPAEEATGLAQELSRRRWEFIRGLSVAQVARLLSAARLYVGNDSGISHLAGLVGAPSLVIFGPTDPAMWAPLGPRVRVAAGRKGMWPSVGQVLEAAREMLWGWGP